MSGRRDLTAERARLRAARTEVICRDGAVLLIALGLARHGTRWGYDGHGCQCALCVGANAARGRKRREGRERRGQRGPHQKPRPELRECALDGCTEKVPLGEYVKPSMYARLRYCSEECANAGRSVALRKARATLTERRCEGCSAVYLPTRARQRFHSKSCGNRHRHDEKKRETKVCQCGCARTFERPNGLSASGWARRRFIDAEHRRRGGYHGPDAAPVDRSPLATRGAGGAEPGAARGGGRTAPRPVPSRDRRQSTTARPERGVPEPTPPIRFGQVAPRPRVEPAQRTDRPRPSFGLTRRTA